MDNKFLPLLCVCCADGTHYFDCYSLYYVLKSKSVSPPTCFFFLKIVLSIWGSLRLHMKFRMNFLFPQKMSLDFDRDFTESVDFFGYYGHFNHIKSYNP